MPGNHDLWSVPEEPLGLRGEARYATSWPLCRRLGVLTPEDPYPIWEGRGGPVTVAPLFLLYDYSFGADVAPTKERRSRGPTPRGWCAATSSCCTPTPTRAGRRGAMRGCARPSCVSTRVTPSCRRCSSTTSPSSATPPADPAPPRVRAVVRDRAHRRLARALRGARGGVRAPAHPSGDLAGRGALHRGLAGLPAGVAPPGPLARRAAPRAARAGRGR